jgi:hypothetical protein
MRAWRSCSSRWGDSCRRDYQRWVMSYKRNMRPRQISYRNSEVSKKCIVDEYLKVHARHIEREHQTFRRFSLGEAIRKATSKEFGTHQRRIRLGALSRFRDRLLAQKSELAKAQDFRSLHSVVLRARVRGIGSLTTYDVARRIGARQGIYPSEVFLHAGARRGAQGLNFIGKTLAMDEIRKMHALANLQPYQIENLFCIYEESLLRYGKNCL